MKKTKSSKKRKLPVPPAGWEAPDTVRYMKRVTATLGDLAGHARDLGADERMRALAPFIMHVFDEHGLWGTTGTYIFPKALDGIYWTRAWLAQFLEPRDTKAIICAHCRSILGPDEEPHLTCSKPKTLIGTGRLRRSALLKPPKPRAVQVEVTPMFVCGAHFDDLRKAVNSDRVPKKGTKKKKAKRRSRTNDGHWAEREV